MLPHGVPLSWSFRGILFLCGRGRNPNTLLRCFEDRTNLVPTKVFNNAAADVGAREEAPSNVQLVLHVVVPEADVVRHPLVLYNVDGQDVAFEPLVF